MVAITMAGSKPSLFLDATVCSLQAAESKLGVYVYSVDKTNESQLAQKPDQSWARGLRYDGATAALGGWPYIARADPIFCC
jgi:hypothetical protein